MFGFPYQIHDAHAERVPEERAKSRDKKGYQITVYLRRRRFGFFGPLREEKWAISSWETYRHDEYRATRLDRDQRILRCSSARITAPWYVKVYKHVLELEKTDRIDLSVSAKPFPRKKPRLMTDSIRKLEG